MTQKKDWTINERGEVCFDGECFGITADPKRGTFSIEFDDDCAVEEVSQAERSLLSAMLNGNGVSLKRRHKGTK